MVRNLIGDRSFYRRVLATAMPIILQNAITNFVSLLDNVMVGQLATAQIGGVTIVNNNLLFIFNIALYGGVSGAGIFTTQFFGSQDHDGIRHSFRFKMLMSLLLTVLGCGIFWFGGDLLIGMYLKGEGDVSLAVDTLFYGRQYLMIMLIGLPAFAMTNAYSSTLRECGQPMVPMIAGFIATGVNMVFNYILIFGKFGFPMLGVAGAAIATVLSRYVEMAIVVLWTHLHKNTRGLVKGLYRSLYIPAPLFKAIVIKGTPLLLNEFFYSLGMAVLNQCYSVCGLDVVPALSISTTLYNLGGVAFRSLGCTVGILTGQMLGAGLPEKEIREENTKMTVFGISSGVLFGGILIAISGLVPKMYNTTDSVRQLATWFIIISSCAMPLQAYIFPVYFTLRSGGKTMITFLFDCGSIWALSIPLAFCLSNFTPLPIIPIFIACHSIDMIKCAVGYVMIKRCHWVQNLTVK